MVGNTGQQQLFDRQLCCKEVPSLQPVTGEEHLSASYLLDEVLSNSLDEHVGDTTLVSSDKPG